LKEDSIEKDLGRWRCSKERHKMGERRRLRVVMPKITKYTCNQGGRGY